MKAQAARPIAEQVSSLETQLSAKVAEAERLKNMLAQTQAKLDVVFVDGWELETRLADAKARLVAPKPPTAPQRDPAADTHAAVQAVAGLSNLLMKPPQYADGVQTAMAHLEQLLAGTGGSPVRSTLGTGAGEEPAMDGGVEASIVYTMAPPPSLFQQSLPSRVGRGRSGRSPATAASAADSDGFIPVPGRSRSLGGRRLTKKSRSDSPLSVSNQVHAGARYFSDEVWGDTPHR